MEQALMDWLDEIIEHRKALESLADYDDSIIAIAGNISYFGRERKQKMVIHIYTGLTKIAEALNLEFYEEEDGYVYYKYKDVYLLQIRERGGDLR